MKEKAMVQRLEELGLDHRNQAKSQLFVRNLDQV